MAAPVQFQVSEHFGYLTAASDCVFRTWDDLVRQALYWGPMPQIDALAKLPAIIYERLVGLEVKTGRRGLLALDFDQACRKNRAA